MSGGPAYSVSMTTQQRTETEPTTYPKRVRVPRGRVTHAARIMDTDAVFTACAMYYGHEIEPKWQDENAEITCRACVKAEVRREREQPVAEQAPQHEVTAPAQLDDEDAWDEPRAELQPAEVMVLRPGLVVEARLAPSGARVRVRLASTPTIAAPGVVTLNGADGAAHDVDATSVTLIGVMPRKGDAIHAQAKTYREVGGERVEGLSPVMRRKLDRDPWPGNPGQLVVSDGRGVDAVLTSTIVILADGAHLRDDEGRIARAVQLAMPGLDFHTNTTSTSSVRVYAKRAEHEGRDDEAVLARNDDIADTLVRRGFYVARRGAGQAVYASAKVSSHAHGDGMCERPGHLGEPAPWIAVLPGAMPLEHDYACRACVTRYVESKRAEQHIDPERPYIVRMWDEQGHALRVAPDASSLDFLGAKTEADAEDIVENLTERGWHCPVQGGEPEHVTAARITIDRGDFESNGTLWKLRPVAVLVPAGADVPGRAVGCSVIGCRKDATRLHRWVDKGYTPPAPKADPKCAEHGRRGVATLGGSLTEITEPRAAQTI